MSRKAFDFLVIPACTVVHPSFAPFYSNHGAAGFKVGDFLRAGGGLLGVGEAAAALLSDWEFGAMLPLERLDAGTRRRGTGRVRIDVNSTGARLLATKVGVHSALYDAGPLAVQQYVPSAKEQEDEAAIEAMARQFQTGPAAVATPSKVILSPRIGSVEVLATFASGIARRGAVTDIMLDRPAIISGRYGDGRIVLFATQPDAGGVDEGEAMIRRAARFIQP